MFDTGAKPDTLLHNFECLEKDITQTELIIISHNHSDHIGGLTGVLDQKHDLTVYLPTTVSDNFSETVRGTGADVIREYDSLQICPHVYLTGEFNAEIIEQALILDTEKGLVVITGCAHPGIVRMLNRAKSIVGKEIYMVIGGFHLLNNSDADIRDIITEFQNLGVQKCAPTHCSGNRAKELFRETYKENYINAGTGKVFSF